MSNLTMAPPQWLIPLFGRVAGPFCLHIWRLGHAHTNSRLIYKRVIIGIVCIADGGSDHLDGAEG